MKMEIYSNASETLFYHSMAEVGNDAKLIKLFINNMKIANLLEITFHLNAISNKNYELYNQSKDGKQTLMHSVYFLLISVDVISKKICIFWIRRV